jgi:predicted nucleic acid-binding protein
MKVLVDSSVIIDYLRLPKSNINTLFMQLYEKTDGLVYSMISVGEIFSGASAIEKINDIKKIFELGEIVNINYAIMEKAGAIRRETKISLIDAIISACALEIGLPVVTLNKKDFQKVSGLKFY